MVVLNFVCSPACKMLSLVCIEHYQRRYMLLSLFYMIRAGNVDIFIAGSHLTIGLDLLLLLSDRSSFYGSKNYKRANNINNIHQYFNKCFVLICRTFINILINVLYLYLSILDRDMSDHISFFWPLITFWLSSNYFPKIWLDLRHKVKQR